MRWFKFFMIVLILGIIGLFIKQNILAFQTHIPFVLNLYIPEPLMWSHPLYVIILISGFVGILVGSAMMLKPFFRVRRLLSTTKQQEQPMSPKEKASTPTEPVSSPDRQVSPALRTQEPSSQPELQLKKDTPE